MWRWEGEGGRRGRRGRRVGGEYLAEAKAGDGLVGDRDGKLRRGQHKPGLHLGWAVVQQSFIAERKRSRRSKRGWRSGACACNLMSG